MEQPGYVPPFTFQTGVHYQVHKSYVWLGPVLSVLTVAVVAALNSIPALVELFDYLSHHSDFMGILLWVGGGLLALLVIYGIVLVIYVLAYKNLSYVFDEREFSLYSGIITKRHVHVPYARVQSVNHKASVLQRIVGVCSVSIDTAGGSANKAVRVPYVTLEVAEAMRTELFLRKAIAAGEVPIPAPSAAPGPAGASAAQPQSYAYERTASNILDEAAGEMGEWRGIFAGQVAGLEPVSFERGLANKELLLTSASHSTPIGLALALGISALITAAGISFADDSGLPAFFADAMVPITIGVAVASWLFGVASVAISYGNFRVRRRGSRIEVERGLLQRSFSGIDLNRIQSIEVRQSFVRRLIGYCEVSLGRINSSQQDSSNNSSQTSQRGLVVHPFIKVSDVDAFLDELIPEFAARPRDTALMRLPKVATRRAVLRHCLWFSGAFYIALCTLAAYLILRWVYLSQFGYAGQALASDPFMRASTLGTTIVLIGCVIATALRAIHAVRWAQQSGFLWNPRYAVLHNGGLWASTITVPRQKIQSGSTRSNPFQRRLGLTSLRLTTAAGSHSTTVELLDVPQEAGDAWLTWLKPRT